MENKGSSKETGKVAPTVDDLLEVLTEQQKKIDLLLAERAAYRPLGKITPLAADSKIVRKDHPDKGGGFIVKMPREWTGERMGVNFRNGFGVIDEEHPQCDYLAHWMEADYGYQVAPATDEQITRLRKMLDGAPVKEREETTAEKLLDVGRIGV